MVKPFWLGKARHAAGVTWLRTRQRLRRSLRNRRISRRARQILARLPRSAVRVQGVFLVSGLGYGGAAKSLTRLARVLAQKGVSSLAIATERTDSPEYPAFREVFAECLDLSHEPDKKDVLVGLLSRLKPELLFCALGVTAYDILPEFKVRCPGARVCDYVPAVGGGNDTYSLPMAAHIDARLLQSEHCRREMLKLYDERDYGEDLRGRLFVAPNCVQVAEEPSHELRLKVRRELDLEQDAFMVCFLGRLSPEKGPGTVLDVAERTAKENPSIRYVLVGDGPLSGEIAKAVEDRRLGSVVRLAGYLEDPAPVLQAADVLIAPSAREGMSNSVLEAMACAKPILCTRVGALSEVVTEDVDGYLVEHGNGMAGAFARHVLRLAEDHALYERLSRQARKAAETKFDEAQRMPELADLVWPQGMPGTSPPHEAEAKPT